jgi:hypothetical protein
MRTATNASGSEKGIETVGMDIVTATVTMIAMDTVIGTETAIGTETTTGIEVIETTIDDVETMKSAFQH